MFKNRKCSSVHKLLAGVKNAGKMERLPNSSVHSFFYQLLKCKVKIAFLRRETSATASESFWSKSDADPFESIFTPEHFFMHAEHPCTALHINETPTHNTIILKTFASVPMLEC